MNKRPHWLRFGASLALLVILDGFLAARALNAEPVASVQRQFDAAGRVLRDQQVDAQGRPHGLLREFYANGVVRYQAQFVEGRREGLEKYFREDASLSRLAYVDGQGRELASVALLADGRLSSLRCADRPLLEGRDRAWCGFSGEPSELPLHDESGRVTAREIWLHGELLRREEYDRNGRLASLQRRNGDHDVRVRYFSNGQARSESSFRVGQPEDRREGFEREWAQTGQLLRESYWQDGQLLSDSQWYLNGRLKERRILQEEENGPALMRIEQYWNSGRLRYRGSQVGGISVGSHERFDEEGRLLQEVRVDGNGMPVLRLEYDPQTGEVRKAERIGPNGLTPLPLRQEREVF
ncbi:hypothetical protein [Pseudomonas sp. RL]|uniref:toxin-antitoxin system YwqK family antitoxin n=1 Tax=Pseudomonas sp. RL TaxID=1452718 RepID=UPI0004856374|nr:hypothetical protein [Pseudomonas sp. RL]